MMVQDITNRDSASRRSVLKGISAGMISVGSLSGNVTALSDGNLAGISYDTLTQKPGSKVTGNININNGALEGSINIAGFSIPMNELKSHRSPGGNATSKFSAELTDTKFKSGDVPLSVTVSRYEDHLAGILSRPSPEYGKLGFYLRDAVETNIEMALEKRQGDPRWERKAQSFSVPETEVPTDTSPNRLMEIASERSNRQNNGGDY